MEHLLYVYCFHGSSLLAVLLLLSRLDTYKPDGKWADVSVWIVPGIIDVLKLKYANNYLGSISHLVGWICWAFRGEDSLQISVEI